MITNMITYSTYLLLEDRVDFLWNQYKGIIMDYTIHKFGSNNIAVDRRDYGEKNQDTESASRNQFNFWKSHDPTPNKQYLDWILNRVFKKKQFEFEDAERLTSALILFNNNKQRLPVDKRDINKIQNLHDLEDLVEPFEGKVSNRQQEKLEKQEGAEVYYEDNDWLMLKITKPEAACYYGKNTKWCTSNINTARDYIKKYSFLLVFIDKKNNRKYQVTPDFNQIMDEKDRELEGVELDNIKSVIKKSGYEEEIKKNPEYAYFYSVDIIKGRWPEAEEYIKKDPVYAYQYAISVIKGRWTEAEEYIKKDSEYAYYYAKDVIKGRFSESKEYIKKNPEYAYYYAKDVIKGRFKEAEPYIKKNPEYAYQYAVDVIKGRFKEAEPYIKKDPQWAYYYALDVIKGRWPEAEEYIKKDGLWYRHYKNYVLKKKDT